MQNYTGLKTPFRRLLPASTQCLRFYQGLRIIPCLELGIEKRSINSFRLPGDRFVVGKREKKYQKWHRLDWWNSSVTQPPLFSTLRHLRGRQAFILSPIVYTGMFINSGLILIFLVKIIIWRSLLKRLTLCHVSGTYKSLCFQRMVSRSGHCFVGLPGLGVNQSSRLLSPCDESTNSWGFRVQHGARCSEINKHRLRLSTNKKGSIDIQRKISDTFILVDSEAVFMVKGWLFLREWIKRLQQPENNFRLSGYRNLVRETN